jgi:hypothetical protein
MRSLVRLFVGVGALALVGVAGFIYSLTRGNLLPAPLPRPPLASIEVRQVQWKDCKSIEAVLQSGSRLCDVINCEAVEGLRPGMTPEMARAVFGSPQGEWTDPSYGDRASYHDTAAGRISVVLASDSGKGHWTVVSYPKRSACRDVVTHAGVLGQIRSIKGTDDEIYFTLRAAVGTSGGLGLHITGDKCDSIEFHGIEGQTFPTRAAVPTGFVELPVRPSRSDFDCANYSQSEWAVSLSNDTLRALPRNEAKSGDQLPFAFKRGEDQVGEQRVRKVSDGWLVGFNSGEFGGGLWWFDEAGGRSERLRPPATAPRHKNDIFQAENVQGFARLGDDIVVFMGLDHLGGRSGRVFWVRRLAGAWVLEPLAALDASPSAWVVEGQRILVLTESGLWQVLPGNRVQRLHALDDVGYLYPSSMVQDQDGTLYVGMRRYVLRLQPTEQGWEESWLVASNCVRARINEYSCQCLP